MIYSKKCNLSEFLCFKNGNLRLHRQNSDTRVNNYGYRLIDFCIDNNMHIINGRGDGNTCADPEFFMRGGPTKMVILVTDEGGGGGPTPQNPEITFFRYNFQIPGGGVWTPGPPPLGPRMQ